MIATRNAAPDRAALILMQFAVKAAAPGSPACRFWLGRALDQNCFQFFRRFRFVDFLDGCDFTGQTLERGFVKLTL